MQVRLLRRLSRRRAACCPAPAAAAKTPWWRRWLPHRSEPPIGSARKAFRKSLPLWIRLRRWLVVLAVLVLVGAFLHFVGRDPIAWVKQQIYALRGTVVAAKNITASSDPKTADPTARTLRERSTRSRTPRGPRTSPAAPRPPARRARAPRSRPRSSSRRKTELTARAINIQAGVARQPQPPGLLAAHRARSRIQRRIVSVGDACRTSPAGSWCGSPRCARPRCASPSPPRTRHPAAARRRRPPSPRCSSWCGRAEHTLTGSVRVWRRRSCRW